MLKIPTVHLVDDDIGVRNSLQFLLQSALLHVQEYESGERFLEEIDPLQPGCMVLDLRMPTMSGMAVLQKLRESKNDIPVIVISGHADVSSAISVMKLGAIDLLQKPFDPLTLLDTVRRALAKSLKMHTSRVEHQILLKRMANLTPRETELLKLVVSGRSNKQIAIDMGIAFKTVVNHRANLMTKTQASNAADLARISTMLHMPQ
jgi:FixJ family two-component response regulator